MILHKNSGFITATIRFTTFFRKNSFIDGTWSAVDLIIWTQVEVGIYLISACLPTYRPLLERIGKRSFVATSTYFKNSNGQHNLDDLRTGSPDIPLNSGSQIRDLGDSSKASSQVGDAPLTDPRILVTTDIQTKWNLESEMWRLGLRDDWELWNHFCWHVYRFVQNFRASRQRSWWMLLLHQQLHHLYL